MADIATLREWFLWTQLLSTVLACGFLFRATCRVDRMRIAFWWWASIGGGALALLMYALFPRASSYPTVHAIIEETLPWFCCGVWIGFVTVATRLVPVQIQEPTGGEGQGTE